MSLDIYLYDPADSVAAVYSSNITHNCGPMAREAGIYEILWRAPENGVTRAEQLAKPLSDAAALLAADPSRFKVLDATNGWGSWRDFLPWVAELAEACRQYPNATISTSR